jgi:iron(III) transport system ATP-binding protein
MNLNCNACGRVLCSIRPEHLTLKEATNEKPENVGTVVGREFKGHDITYHVQLHGEKYLVHTDNRILFEPNDAVVIKPLESAVILEGEK